MLNPFVYFVFIYTPPLVIHGSVVAELLTAEAAIWVWFGKFTVINSWSMDNMFNCDFLIKLTTL